MLMEQILIGVVLAAEAAVEMGKGIVKRVGIQDQFGQSAPYERLLAINGVTVENIMDIAKKMQ